MQRAVTMDLSSSGGYKRSRDMAANTIIRAVRKADFSVKRKRKRNVALSRHVVMPVICIERTCVANLGLFSATGIAGSVVAGLGSGAGLGFDCSLF